MVLRRVFPPGCQDTEVSYRGAASTLHRKPERLVGQRLWFGFGFSERIYPIQKAAAIAAWGIRRSLGMDAQGREQGGLLIVIPDALERINHRAERIEPYRFVPLSEPLDGETEGRIAKRTQERAEGLRNELARMGYLPTHYEIRLASQICQQAQTEGAEVAVRLEDLERMLFNFKNLGSHSFANFAGEGRMGGRREAREADGAIGPAMEAEEARIRLAQQFRNDLARIPLDILGRKMEGRLDAQGMDARARYYYMSWMSEYPLKQAALTIYMAYGTPARPIKIGPVMEARFDRTVYSLLGDTYGKQQGISGLLKGNRFGTVLVEPECEAGERAGAD